MKKTFSYFVDESGMFHNLDTNVICSLIMEDDAVSLEQILDLWKVFYPGKAWSEFHSNKIGHFMAERVFRKIHENLLCIDGVSVAYAYHRSKINYKFDFYNGMLLRFLSCQFENILRNQITNFNCKSSDTLQLYFKVHLAERVALNTLLLEKKLQRRNRRCVKSLAADTPVGLDRLTYNINVYPILIKRDPFVQVSDSLSNVIRGYYNSAVFNDPISGILQGIDKLKLSEQELNTAEIKKICKQLRQAEIKVPIPQPQEDKANKKKKSPKKKQKIKTKVVTRAIYVPHPDPVETIPNEILKRAAELKGEAESNAIEKFDNLIKSFEELDERKQGLIVDRLLEVSHSIIQVDRDYLFGGLMVYILNRLVEIEKKGGTSPQVSANRRELLAATLHLFVKNHRGLITENDPRIENALAIVPGLLTEISCWILICDFQNNLAVSKHNRFLFDKAIEDLYPTVQRFEQELKNPLTGHGIKAFEIGAFFGTYAQSLAFSAHCRFFNEGSGVLDETLEEAGYYSELAQEHFDDPLDTERQITYRSHYRMQKYILTGDRAALKDAGELLRTDGRSEKVVDDFLSSFPSRKCLTPAFRICALLKQSYLSKNPPAWLDEINAAVIADWQALPVEHPMELLLPYLILLSSKPEPRRALANALKLMDFTGQLTDTIKSIMQLQIEYEAGQTISDESLQAAETSIIAAIKPQWDRYGLNMIIRRYKKQSNHWNVGPMEVLLFNYC